MKKDEHYLIGKQYLLSRPHLIFNLKGVKTTVIKYKDFIRYLVEDKTKRVYYYISEVDEQEYINTLT